MLKTAQIQNNIKTNKAFYIVTTCCVNWRAPSF